MHCRLVLGGLPRPGTSRLNQDLQAIGVGFVSLNDGIDPGTPAGRLQLPIVASLSEVRAMPDSGASGRGWRERTVGGRGSVGHARRSLRSEPVPPTGESLAHQISVQKSTFWLSRSRWLFSFARTALASSVVMRGSASIAAIC